MSKTPTAVSGAAWPRAETTVLTAAKSVLHRIASASAAAVARRVAMQLEHRAIAELSALDDRMLKDIGLTRAAIPNAASSAMREAMIRSYSS